MRKDAFYKKMDIIRKNANRKAEKPSLVKETIKGLPAAARKVGKNIVTAPMKLVDRAIEADKKSQAGKRARNKKMIEKNFGNVDNYLNTLPAKKSTKKPLKSMRSAAKSVKPLKKKVLKKFNRTK